MFGWEKTCWMSNWRFSKMLRVIGDSQKCLKMAINEVHSKTLEINQLQNANNEYIRKLKELGEDNIKLKKKVIELRDIMFTQEKEKEGIRYKNDVLEKDKIKQSLNYRNLQKEEALWLKEKRDLIFIIGEKDEENKYISYKNDKVEKEKNEIRLNYSNLQKHAETLIIGIHQQDKQMLKDCVVMERVMPTLKLNMKLCQMSDDGTTGKTPEKWSLNEIKNIPPNYNGLCSTPPSQIMSSKSSNSS